jgi:hypothetical protein
MTFCLLRRRHRSPTERHDRRAECEELEDACSAQVRTVQAQLASEREHRVEAEARVGEAFSDEAQRLNSQISEANERSDEAQARCRALEIKVTDGHAKF